MMRGLCLDFDCTIVDSFQRGLKWLERIVTDMNFPYTPEMRARIISMWGDKPIDIITRMWPDGDCELINKMWHDDGDAPIPLVPGGFEAMVKLFCNFHLSILTSRGRDSLLFHIDSYKYLFKFVIAFGDIDFHKPDPRSIEAVIERYKILGVKREEIIYVGDTPHIDWPPAKDCGIEFYGVTTGPNKREKFLEIGLDENHILDSIADLPDVLLK